MHSNPKSKRNRQGHSFRNARSLVTRWLETALFTAMAVNPPCRSSGGGWKTRFISPWQDGILLPIPARGVAG